MKLRPQLLLPSCLLRFQSLSTYCCTTQTGRNNPHVRTYVRPIIRPISDGAYARKCLAIGAPGGVEQLFAWSSCFVIHMAIKKGHRIYCTSGHSISPHRYKQPNSNHTTYSSTSKYVRWSTSERWNVRTKTFGCDRCRPRSRAVGFWGGHHVLFCLNVIFVILLQQAVVVWKP